jgi:flagellar basal-body rod protein FlgB
MDANFQFFVQALNARAYRQQVLASNIANADTPNYRARDVDFKQLLGEAQQTHGIGGTLQLAASSSQHLPGVASAFLDDAVYYRTPLQSSLDKNSVDMDIERAQFTDNALHYEATLAFLNQEIKTMQIAVQG